MGTGRQRWVAIAGGVLIVAALVGIATLPSRATPAPAPGSTGSPQPSLAATGPEVYFELVDAHASRLMARTLDGRSEPRLVASRTDVDSGPAWSVDPTGRTAVVVADGTSPDGGLDLVAYRIADGSSRWTVHVDPTWPDVMRWNADGSLLAALTDQSENDRRAIVFVDVAGGTAHRVGVPDDVSILGFAGDGGLIAYQVVNDGQPDASVRFLRIDPGTLAVERLTTLPDVGPDVGSSRSVDPRIGAVVDLVQVEDQSAAKVTLHDVRTGSSRPIATLPSVDLVAIAPTDDAVAVAVDGGIRSIAFDGRADDLYSTDDRINTLHWSSDGAYLLVETSGDPVNLVVVERSSGRAVTLPLPHVADAHLVAVTASRPLPVQALPASEPAPTPTPGPAGGDIAAQPILFSSWVAPEGGRLVGHAQRLIATDSGGVRVAAEMPPIDLGPVPAPDESSTSIELLPRPGSSDVLVWISEADASRGMVWDGDRSVTPLALPNDWPANGQEIAWRPDGRAIAGSAVVSGLDGETQGFFVVADIGGAHTTKIPIEGDYDRLEGWWSMSELRVGHVVCTEGCPGRYSFSARLRIADHRLRELTPADRGHEPIDYTYRDDQGRLVMTMRSEDPAANLAVVWPDSLGPTDSLDVRVASDGRSLLVMRTVESTTEVYRVDDVVGRAAHGVLADPRPVRIGTVEGRDGYLTFASGEAYATFRDRVGDQELVRLSDGRTWPLDRDRDLTWGLPAR